MSSDTEPQHDGRPESQPPTSFLAGPVGKIVIIWALMTAVGVVIGVALPGHMFPRMLSKEGHVTVVTVILFTVLAAPVAAVVYGIAAYSLVAWRHRGPLDEPPPDGPPLRGNNTVTSIWLLTSGVLVLVLLIWGLAQFNAEEAAPHNSLQVDVIGQQWLWTFKYPGTGVETNTLELPDNRPVQFNVTSEDVTHGFWVPNLGVQVDANPGEITVIHATTNRQGHLYVRCSQLCGLYHANMWTTGAVVSPQNFARWLESKGSGEKAAMTDADVTAAHAVETSDSRKVKA